MPLPGGVVLDVVAALSCGPAPAPYFAPSAPAPSLSCVAFLQWALLSLLSCGTKRWDHPASLFSRFSPLETGWLAQLLIPGMRRSFSKTGADPGDQLLGPRDQLLFLVRGSAPEIRAPPFPIGPPHLPTAPACCPAQGPASAGKPHVKSARRERGNLRRYATESTASPSRSGTIAVYTGSMTTTTALNKVSFCVSRERPGYEAVCDSPLLSAFFSRFN